MNQNAIVKAEILSQALPYIQKYHDKIVVIKYVVDQRLIKL